MVMASLARKNAHEKQDNARSGNVPDQRAHKIDTKRIEGQVHDSSGEVQEHAPFGECPVRTGQLNSYDEHCEKRERFEEVTERACKPTRDARE